MGLRDSENEYGEWDVAVDGSSISEHVIDHGPRGTKAMQGKYKVAAVVTEAIDGAFAVELKQSDDAALSVNDEVLWDRTYGAAVAAGVTLFEIEVDVTRRYTGGNYTTLAATAGKLIMHWKPVSDRMGIPLPGS